MKTLASIAGREKNCFGLLRLLAASLVVVSHAYALTSGSVYAEPLLSTTSYPLGGHAVHMFFALSGFLIAASWYNKPDLTHFLTGRFLRLVPGLFIVILSVILVAGLVAAVRPASTMFGLGEVIRFGARTLFLLDGGGNLPSVFPQDKTSGSILATVWTLRYEVLCYLSVPLLGLLAFRRKSGAGVFVFAVLALSMAYLVFKNTDYHSAGIFDHLARFYFTFYLGVAAWMARKYIRLSFVFAGLLFATMFFALDTVWSKPLEIICVAYTTFWFGSLKFGTLEKVTNRHDLSYGIYLIGYPVQLALIGLLPAGHSPLVNITATMIVVLPLAFLSWRYVESPALSHRRSLTNIISQSSMPSREKSVELGNEITVGKKAGTAQRRGIS